MSDLDKKLQNLRDVNETCLLKHDEIVQLVINFLEENFHSWEDYENSKFEIPENMSLIRDVWQTALEKSWGGTS